MDTLLAELGKLGRKNNIEFLSIAPQKMLIADKNITEKKSSDNFNQTYSENDPFLVEGIKKYLIDFTFTTDFVNLLSFLRDLEFKDNAMVKINLNILISLFF